MEASILILLHVFFAIIWAGGAIAVGFFVIPAVIEAGPAGGTVMAGVAKRKLPAVLTFTGVVVLLSGLRLYMIVFSSGWIRTLQGISVTLGALLGVSAFIIGVFMQRPTVMRIGALGAQIGASGGPPSPEQAAEMAVLRARMGKLGKVVGWHLLGAAFFMSAHVLAAML
jgi:uncharacterized membrane protein